MDPGQHAFLSVEYLTALDLRVIIPFSAVIASFS